MTLVMSQLKPVRILVIFFKVEAHMLKRNKLLSTISRNTAIISLSIFMVPSINAMFGKRHVQSTFM